MAICLIATLYFLVVVAVVATLGIGPADHNTLNCIVVFASVYAKDGGLPPNYAKATVMIRVLDENDNAPVFGRQYYIIEVPENMDSRLLFTLRATDQDVGDGGKINYRITGEDV